MTRVDLIPLTVLPKSDKYLRDYTIVEGISKYLKNYSFECSIKEKNCLRVVMMCERSSLQIVCNHNQTIYFLPNAPFALSFLPFPPDHPVFSSSQSIFFLTCFSSFYSYLLKFLILLLFYPFPSSSSFLLLYSLLLPFLLILFLLLSTLPPPFSSSFSSSFLLLLLFPLCCSEQICWFGGQ